MKNTLETRLGIFAALAIIAAVVLLEVIGGTDVFKKSYRLYALFNNVQDLKVGDAVKMAGVKVGRVDDIQLTDKQVKVTLRMNKGAVVRSDSKASVRFMGLMGQNYVALDMGGGVPLGPDQLVQTVEQADLNVLMARLDNVASGIENVTKSFSGDRIDNLLGPLTDFFKRNKDDLSATIGNIKVVSDNMAQGKGTVGKLLTDDALYNSALTTVKGFESTSGDLRAALNDAKLTLSRAETVITNINQTITDINSGHGTIGRLIKDEKLYTETTDAMTNLKEILQKINQGQGTVGKLVNDESLIKNAKATLQKLDKATDSLEDQGPMTVIGMAVGKVF